MGEFGGFSDFRDTLWPHFWHQICFFRFANWATDFHDQLAQSKSKSNWASGRLAISCTDVDQIPRLNASNISHWPNLKNFAFFFKTGSVQLKENFVRIIFPKFTNFIQENYHFEVDCAIWGLVSDIHIYGSANWVIIGSGNGLLPLGLTPSHYWNQCWLLISYNTDFNYICRGLPLHCQDMRENAYTCLGFFTTVNTEMMEKKYPSLVFCNDKIIGRRIFTKFQLTANIYSIETGLWYQLWGLSGVCWEFQHHWVRKSCQWPSSPSKRKKSWQTYRDITVKHLPGKKNGVHNTLLCFVVINSFTPVGCGFDFEWDISKCIVLIKFTTICSAMGL